jgi:endonuclease V-like protein UPF0215 family
MGIDDGPFERGSRRDVLVVGAVYSAGQFEGLVSSRVRQDGFNATDRLIQMISGSKFQQQVHLVMTDGITMGGFNMVDLPRLQAAIEIPVVAVTRHRPDQRAINAALESLPRASLRRRIMKRAGPIHRAGSLFFQAVGVDPELAGRVIRSTVTCGRIPECLRAAHLIAGGVVMGESGRRA